MSLHSSTPSYEWSTGDESSLTRASAGTEGKKPETPDSKFQSILVVKHEREKREEAHNYYYGRTHEYEAGSGETRTSAELLDEAPMYPEELPLDELEPVMTEQRHLCDYLLIYVVMGYLTGIFLVLCWYMKHYRKESGDLNTKWFIGVLVGLLLLLIAHSPKLRCVTLLAVPTFGGFRGWSMLMCIALILVFTGPLLNILRNIESMAYSMSCEQTLLRNALTPMHQILGEPVYVVEQAVYILLSQVRRLMERLDEVLQRLETHIARLHVGFKNADTWLEQQENFFENQMGSPYERCLGAGRVCVQECEAKFRVKPSICDHEKRFEWFCSNLKDLPDFFEGHLKEQQQLVEQLFSRPLVSFTKIRSMFEVSITFDHTVKAAGNRDAINSDLDQHIAMEIDLQYRHFRLINIYLHIILFGLLVTIINATIYFRLNYLGSINFSNHFITKEFGKIDVNEEKFYGRRVLPLRNVEKKTYVWLSSMRLLTSEVRYMHRSFVFMIIVGIQLFTICFVDYSLFLTLTMMSNHTHGTADLQPPEYTKILVWNGGMIGGILRGLIEAFEPMAKNLIVDIQRCLPLPRPPKYLRYWEIGMICIVAWFLLVFKSYSMRLRHAIMIFVYPYYARTRAMYFHHCMQFRRDIFIKIAKRRARSLNNYYYDNWVIHLLAFVRAKLYRITNGYLGTYMGLFCIICDSKLTTKDYIKCTTPECRGVYCQPCFLESDCICILCTYRVKYGDVSDFSDIEDSSDDPDSISFQQGTKHTHDNQERHKDS